jgi:hypothetical protein
VAIAFVAVVAVASVGAVISGDFGGNEVGVVHAVLVDDEVDEIPSLSDNTTSKRKHVS